MILNINVLFLRVWGVQYREELILTDSVMVARVWEGNRKTY